MQGFRLGLRGGVINRKENGCGNARALPSFVGKGISPMSKLMA